MKQLLFLNQSGGEVTEIQAGDPLILRLVYECASPEVLPTMVDIHIVDQGGVFYHNPHALECPTLRGRGYIDVRFDSIPANNQRLIFSIALTGIGSWELYDWKRGLPLTVHGSPNSQGRVHLTCTGKVVPADSDWAQPAEIPGKEYGN